MADKSKDFERELSADKEFIPAGHELSVAVDPDWERNHNSWQRQVNRTTALDLAIKVEGTTTAKTEEDDAVTERIIKRATSFCSYIHKDD